MWFKNFRHRKLQTLLTIFIILLCALLLSTSLCILLSMNVPMEQLSKESQSADAILYPYSEKNEEVKGVALRLQALEEIDKVVCVQTHSISEEMTSNGRNITTFTNLTKYEQDVFANIRCVAGNVQEFQMLEEGECIVPACVCVANDLELGDSLTIHMPNKTYTYTIKGIYADIYSTSNAFSNYILIKELPGEISSELQIRIYTKENVTEEQILDSYEETYGAMLEGQLYSKENALENSLLAVRIMGGILLAIGAVMMLTSCLIINFIVRNTLTSDAKTIAVYKTIGYEYSMIRNIYVKFYAAITTVAVFMGIVVSKYLSDSILNDLFVNIGIKADVKNVSIGIGIYFAILLLVLFTVYLVTNKTKKMKPIYALAGMGPTDTTKMINFKRCYGFTFSPVGIALRMILRDKKGTLGILMIAIISVIGINFALISLDVANGMKDHNDYWLGIDKSDVIISLSDGATAKGIEKLLMNDLNIEKLIPNRMSGVLIVKRESGKEDAVVYPFVYDDYSKVDVNIVTGRNPKNGEEIALAGKIADTLNKDVGDYIELYFENESKSFLITGLYQTYYNSGDSCRLTRDAYEDTSFSFDTMSVYLKDNSHIDHEVERIGKIIGGNGNVIPRTEQFASIMDMIAEPQKSVVPAVMLMVVLIGSLNIFCLVMLKNNKDKKMNGIYKCIGYSTAHLTMANICFVSLLAAVSILIAIPLVLYLYPGIMRLTLGMMFGLLEYRVEYNIVHIVVGNMIVFGFFIISTFLSSEGIRKVNVRDLVLD